MYRPSQARLEWMAGSPNRLAPSIKRVHFRRALLLFALVLGMTAIAASVAPPPTEEQGDERTGAPETPEPVRPEAGRAPFRYPLERDARPAVRRAEPAQPLTVTVAASEPGQARIPLLGRVASVTPNDPARFDLLTPASGSYDVQFRPVEGDPQRLGKIVVRSQR
jgi:hypothetical protein